MPVLKIYMFVYERQRYSLRSLRGALRIQFHSLYRILYWSSLLNNAKLQQKKKRLVLYVCGIAVIMKISERVYMGAPVILIE